jgi:hypothetical protein
MPFKLPGEVSFRPLGDKAPMFIELTDSGEVFGVKKINAKTLKEATDVLEQGILGVSTGLMNDGKVVFKLLKLS